MAFFMDVLMLSSFFISYFVSEQIWSGLKEQLTTTICKLLVEENKSTESYEVYSEYCKLMYTKLKSSSERVIPLALGLFVCSAFFTEWFSFAYNIWSGPGYGVFYVTGIQEVYRILALLTQGLLWGWWILFLASFMFSIYLEFWMINKIGYEKPKDKSKGKKKNAQVQRKAGKQEDEVRFERSYPLAIDYIDLQMGSFEDLGKFVLMTVLPGIFLGTILGITGVATIFFNNDLVWGYGYIFGGIFLVIILTILLYKNTTNIHKGIVKSKTFFKEKAYHDIQNLWKVGQEPEKKEINYDRIKQITDFVQTIDAVSDWPFNPASLKKLAVTVMTAVVPLIFSFFGLNITL